MSKPGFKTQRVDVQGAVFNLTEISAQQRVEFLQRAVSYDSKDGFELINNDLAMSADLVALHLRSVLPQWWLRRKVRRMPAGVIAELFNHCVVLSNVPFFMRKADEHQDEAEQEAAVDQEDD